MTPGDNIAPVSSNNSLINGKMNYDCSKAPDHLTCTPNAGLSKFGPLTPGKRYLFRVVNTAAEALYKFSIDGHKMSVVENDFVPCEPYDVDVVTLDVGQRAHVIIEATRSPGDTFWMRGLIAPRCSLNDGVSPLALAAVYYDGADTTARPNSTSSVPQAALDRCANDPLDSTNPTYPLDVAAKASTLQELHIEFKQNQTHHNLFWVNDSPFRDNYNDPNLLRAVAGNLSFPTNQNVYNFGANETVRLVVYNHFPASHPMHLHGHNMYILTEGFGEYHDDALTAAQLRNPIRRDTQLLQAAADKNTPAYMVVQYDGGNPGVWPFHCHIAWHVSAGLYVNLVDSPGLIEGLRVPGAVRETCREWSEWTGENVPDQIDSGL